MNLADGEIYSWGSGFLGELGLAYLEKTEEPSKVTKVRLPRHLYSITGHCSPSCAGAPAHVMGSSGVR